jgi:amino acid transporter
MRRIGCLIGITGYIFCLALWIILAVIFARIFEIEDFWKVFSFIVVWIIVSSILSTIILLLSVKASEKIFNDAIEEDGLERFFD